MRSKPFLIAAFVAGMTVAAFPARADRDSMGAGIVFGGAIGAVLGGPPGWVAGMAIGAARGLSGARVLRPAPLLPLLLVSFQNGGGFSGGGPA